MEQITLFSLFPQDLTRFFLKAKDQQMTDWTFLFPLASQVDGMPPTKIQILQEKLLH